MKKFLVTILSILYMASAMGATVHIHYCMGKVEGLSFIHKDEERCRKCGMKKAERSKGCCKDEYKTIKTNDHKSTIATYDFSHQISPQLKPDYSLQSETVFFYYQNRTIDHLPPIVCRTCPIYIKDRNFRI